MSLSVDLGSNRKPSIRPDWASHQPSGYPISKSTAKTLAQSTEWNAGIRPAPVRPPVPKMSERAKKACARTERSSPSLMLFESQPWHVPASHRESDEE